MEVAGTKTGHPSTLLAPWPSFLMAYTKHFWLLAVQSTLLERPLRFLPGDFTPHRPDSHQPPSKASQLSHFWPVPHPDSCSQPPHCSQTAQEGLNSGQRQLHTLNPDSQH